jgi:hypothetical protein
MLTPTDLQRQTLRLYGELISRFDTLGGRLVFTCGAGSSAGGLPAAVSIAGGTTLAVDPDVATVKAVLRLGGVDFVVNTLDEALRVLKNEIRQHRPLGVGLIAEIEPVVAEMIERGVLPDLHVSLDKPISPVAPGPQPAEPADLRGPGKQHLHLATREGIAAPTPLFTGWLEAHNWSESVIVSTTETPLRALDAQLLAALSTTDAVRRTWLRRISHYQRVSPSRALWLGPAESV